LTSQHRTACKSLQCTPQVDTRMPMHTRIMRDFLRLSMAGIQEPKLNNSLRVNSASTPECTEKDRTGKCPPSSYHQQNHELTPPLTNQTGWPPSPGRLLRFVSVRWLPIFAGVSRKCVVVHTQPCFLLLSCQKIAYIYYWKTTEAYRDAPVQRL